MIGNHTYTSEAHNEHCVGALKGWKKTPANHDKLPRPKDFPKHGNPIKYPPSNQQQVLPSENQSSVQIFLSFRVFSPYFQGRELAN